MLGEDTFQCQATGCWEPNALPKCIDENMISSWDHRGAGASSLWAVLVSVIVVTAVVSTISAVCGVLVCKRRRTLSHNPVPHWSTHVTVTPTVSNPNHNNNNNNNTMSAGAKPNGDRMTLMAYSDQVDGRGAKYKKMSKINVFRNMDLCCQVMKRL